MSQHSIDQCTPTKNELHLQGGFRVQGFMVDFFKGIFNLHVSSRFYLYGEFLPRCLSLQESFQITLSFQIFKTTFFIFIFQFTCELENYCISTYLLPCNNIVCVYIVPSMNYSWVPPLQLVLFFFFFNGRSHIDWLITKFPGTLGNHESLWSSLPKNRSIIASYSNASHSPPLQVI